MNKNIQKTVIFLALLCMFNFAMAMDPPQLEHPEELLTTVTRILQKKGRKAAIEFLESQNKELVNREIFLKALKDDKKHALLKIKTKKYWLDYIEKTTDSLTKQIYIETIISLLSDNLELLSDAFYQGNSNFLLRTIMELKALKKDYGKRKSFSQIELDLGARYYNLILNGQDELIEGRLSNNATLTNKNDRRLSDAITKILRGIEKDLREYCISNFFHIWIQYYEHEGNFYELKTCRNNIANNQIKNIPSLKTIISARQEINCRIMKIETKETLEREEFIQINEIIDLTVDFVKKFSQQTARRNFSIIAHINHDILENTHICLKGADALSSSSSDERNNRFKRREPSFESGSVSRERPKTSESRGASSERPKTSESREASSERPKAFEEQELYTKGRKTDHYGVKGSAERQRYKEEMKSTSIPELVQNRASRRWSIPSLPNLYSRGSKNVSKSDSNIRKASK